MTKQQEDISQPKTNPLNAIPLERLSVIHQNVKSYQEEWDKNKVIQIADLSTIDNAYTALLHNLSKITSATGAGIYLYGEINGSSNYYKGVGGSITVTSLSIDFLVSNYRERRYQPEEKLVSEVENLYNNYQELITLLQHLRDSDSSPESNKLIKILKEKLTEIVQKGEIKENSKRIEYLSYIFWSLEKDKSSDIKELILLNNGVKALDSWDKLSFPEKAQSWLNSLSFSRRNDTGWTEWKQVWETRRNEHEKIKYLISILQKAVSECKQGISSEEIEEGIKKEMSNLEATTTEFEKESLTNTSNNNSSGKLLEDKNTLPTGSTSQPTSLFHRNINRQQGEDVEMGAINQDQKLEACTEFPPKK